MYLLNLNLRLSGGIPETVSWWNGPNQKTEAFTYFLFSFFLSCFFFSLDCMNEIRGDQLFLLLRKLKGGFAVLLFNAK